MVIHVLLWCPFVFGFFSSITVVSASYGGSFKPVVKACGPDKTCLCTYLSHSGTAHHGSGIKMDCSKRKVTLKSVCHSLIRENNVSYLDVSSVKFGTLTKTDLKGCHRLEQLNMKRCDIFQIDNDTFIGMGNLKWIDLSVNDLKQYYTGHKPTFLSPLKNLTELRFRILSEEFVQNTNVSVSYPDLHGLDRLKSLHIDGLPGTKFPTSYSQMRNLKNLTLSGGGNTFCSLNNLTNQTFENVLYVENLFISRCNITKIEAGTMKVLTSLKRIDISLNRQLGFQPLSNLSYGLQYTNVEFLNYSRNCYTFGLSLMITKRDICYLRNTSLKEVAVDGMRLDLFETNSPILLPDSLNIVHVNDNRFTFGLFLLQMACVKNVTTLDANLLNFAHHPSRYTQEVLSDQAHAQCEVDTPSSCPFLDEGYLLNVSKTIPNCQYFNRTPEKLSGGSFPRKLKSISFSKSKVEYSLGRIPVLPLNNEIEYIDISGNIFFKLYGPVGPLTSLTSLKMSRNYCTDLGPELFLYARNLREIHAEENLLGDLLSNASSADVFKPLSKLRFLNVSKNQIKELSPNIFTHLPSLEILDISYNSLDELTIDTTSLVNLSQLYLKSNSLQTLPDSLIEHFTVLANRKGMNLTIDLKNNPLRYSCRNRRFLEWMVQNKRFFAHMKKYKFYDDAGNLLTAVQMKEKLQYIDQQCMSYTVIIVVSTVGLSVFLSVVIFGLVYKNRWNLRYFLHMNKARFRGYRPHEPLINFRYDAFVSYSDENSEFRDEMIKVFEDDNDVGIKLNLCIHERDFRPGRAITENIIDAIQTSKRTVIALSKAYLKSKWCMYEFHMARMESIYSRTGSSIIVIVMLEPVSLDDDIPLELMQWIRNDSYIEYTNHEQGQIVFWNKLRDAILE